MTPDAHRWLCSCGLFYLADEPSCCSDCAEFPTRLAEEEARVRRLDAKFQAFQQREAERVRVLTPEQLAAKREAERERQRLSQQRYYDRQKNVPYWRQKRNAKRRERRAAA